MPPNFSPTGYILHPPETAWVERLPDGQFLIRWNEPVEQVAVSVAAGLEPNARQIARFDRRVAHSDRSVVVNLPQGDAAMLIPARPYFHLDLDGRHYLIAERTLPVGNGVNFRDLGGYRTTDGRAVRWGKVYRAGSLADLSEDDIAYLHGLGVRLSCDLRSPEEVDSKPDRLPPGAVARHLPIAAVVGRVRRAVTLFRKRHRVQELLLDVYKVMLDQNGPIFAEVIRAAADPANLPLVIHCTAGKDRTGLAAALLLLALGVPEETVIADYTLSNHAFDVLAGRMRPEMERLYALGFGELQVRPFLLAEARTMEGALAHLRRRYGSVEWYLLRAGLDEAALERLRGTLLEG